MFLSLAIPELAVAAPSSAADFASSLQDNSAQSSPSASNQLLAEVFPNTRPGSSGDPAQLTYGSPNGNWRIGMESGAETVNGRVGGRLGLNGSLYTPERRWGFRFDAADVESEERREILNLLFSAGTLIGEDAKFVASAGWLSRYAWTSIDGLGDQGDQFNQYVAAAELEKQLRAKSADLFPGVAASLSGLFFKSDSKTLWSGQEVFESSSTLTRYFSQYGIGGGSQYEALAGLSFLWNAATLDVRGGLRHKEFDEYLGNASTKQDAPKIMTRFALNDIFGGQVAAYYTWDTDLWVLGAEVRRNLYGPLGIVARAETVQGSDRPDDNRFFVGLDLAFGSANEITLASKELASRAASSPYRGDWLKPVTGSNVEYLQVMRQVQQRTRLVEIQKGGLANGVTTNIVGDLSFNTLPQLAAIVNVSPPSAAAAFYLSNGQLKAYSEKLPAPADILLQVQQANGLSSMVRISTSHGSVIVNEVQYNTNLTDYQVAAITGNPNLLMTPPSPPPPPQVVNNPPSSGGSHGGTAASIVWRGAKLN